MRKTAGWIVVALAVCASQTVAATLATAAAKPHWIWPGKDVQPNERVFFRKSFELPADVKKAQVAASCDNVLTLFINGEHVLQSNEWQAPAHEDVTRRLKKGENLIALRGINDASGQAAMILRLDVELADGKKLSIVTDKSWRSSREEVKGWQSPDFDDSAWQAPHVFGPLGIGPWNISLVPGEKPPAPSVAQGNVQALPGFEVELIYTVPKQTQGSWVSMTTDPKGRLIVSDQGGQGLFRVTPGADAETTEVEKLNVDMSQAQGMLYVEENNTLYVSRNGGGSGFYALRDTDGDDQFDEVKLLKKFNGGGEHGPHGVRRGPDGKLYVIAGNHTKIPDGIAPTSPHRNWAEDLLLKRNPDGRGHATGRMAPAGWIARTDLAGEKWELFCAGFRNAYDIDFSDAGELFTYDSDMEWDTGTPWYRPTRVNHCTSAAEFGWRFGTGKWPEYFVDSRPAVVDIGLGSPTGVTFGRDAKFPPKYQQALFINDWTYGKLYAVHLKPNGASYDAQFEVFVQGRPLPLTDVVINPKDGAMYFTVGGRGTQSHLYRVKYVGGEAAEEKVAHAADNQGQATDGTLSEAEKLAAEKRAKAARALRRRLEKFHVGEDPQAVDVAWEHLNSRDRAIRYAARVAIERQPLEQWKEKALAENRTMAKIQAMVALTRTADETLQSDVLQRLATLRLDRLNEEQTLDALRAYALAFIRLGGKNETNVKSVIAKLNPLFPSPNPLVNRELCRLLVYLEAPGVIDRGMNLLAQAQTQQDQLYYAFVLRNLKEGWTPQQRRAYFSWLNLAEQKYRGGASFKNFIQQIRTEVVASLSDDEKAELRDVIEGRQQVEVVKLETTRQFKHNWQLDDLLPLLADVESGRNFERGRAAYEAAQCAKCHRFAGEGGATGPDITGVGNRFTPQYLLEAMIIPSKVISDQYVNSTFYTEDGEVISGRVIEDDGKMLKIRTDPFSIQLTEVPKAKIEESVPSRISEMPEGLINVLEKEEVLDLIAYLRSGGNRQDAAFAD